MREEKESEERRCRCTKREESRDSLCFPMICGSGGSKDRLAKAAGAKPCDQMRHEKLRAIVARCTCGSKKAKSTARSEHFWKLRCRKSARRCGAKHISNSKCTKHASLNFYFWKLRCRKRARRCGAKHISNSKCTKHASLNFYFWKLRCRKRARRCGAKHISNSKCTKHTNLGPLLEVQMSKQCTPLWREAHFQVKSVKN